MESLEDTILSFKKLKAMEEIRESIKNFDRILFKLLLSKKANSKAVLFLHNLYFYPYYPINTTRIDKKEAWQYFRCRDRITKIYQILVEGAVTIKH